MLDTLTILVLIATITSLCVYFWMRAARIPSEAADRASDAEAERLWMHMRETDWRWPR